jgi:hypothetical protein
MAFPDFPGVPPLLNNPLPAAALLASPVLSNLLDMLAPKWGIFTESGAQAVVPDSFLELDYVNSSNIPTYPQEQGAFASYNKVPNPRAHSIGMSKGGSKKEMTDFLTLLESLGDSLDLFTIVTPNRSYPRTNIDKCEYRRSSFGGAGIIVATIHFTEIRQASAAFSQPGGVSATDTVPSAQAQVDNGQTYPSLVQNAIGGVIQ